MICIDNCTIRNCVNMSSRRIGKFEHIGTPDSSSIHWLPDDKYVAANLKSGDFNNGKHWNFIREEFKSYDSDVILNPPPVNL